jgi:hypothetical protein
MKKNPNPQHTTFIDAKKAVLRVKLKMRVRPLLPVLQK